MSIRSGLLCTVAALGAFVPSLAVAQTPPTAYTSATRYDLDRRVVGTIAPDPDGTGPLRFLAVRNTYNAQGWLTKVERGELFNWQPDSVAPSAWPGFTVFQTIDTAYDAAGRKLSETVTANGVAETRTQWSYDSLDRVMCATVRMKKASNFASAPADACVLDSGGAESDRITRTLYDPAGRVQTIQKAYGTPLQQDYVAYTYTPNGQQATVTDANGATARYGYDRFDRMARWYFPSKAEAGVASTDDYEEYAYDPGGNRTSFRRRSGDVITYAYDSRNRPFHKRMPVDKVAPVEVPASNCGELASDLNDVCTSYDNRGLMTAARYGGDDGQGVLFEYDGIGRQTASTLTMGGTSQRISYIWQDNNKRATIIHPDGYNFVYRYDNMDRVTAIRENGTPPGAVQIAYDNQGRIATLTRPGTVVSYGYDSIGRLGTLFDDKVGASGDLTTTLGYSPASQIVSRGRDNEDFVYASGVTAARAYSINGLNQYLTSGPVSLTYDTNGNLASETVGDITNTYAYDGENRLIQKQVLYPPCPKGAQCQPMARTTLRYDPLGRLYEVSTNPGGATQFLYDGDELVFETNTGGDVRRYVHGPGDDDPLLSYVGSNLSNRRQLFSDHQGSIVGVADANGNPLAINTYDDWGIPGSANNNVMVNGRFQYTGQIWLPEIGMYHYKARFYSPTLGRFLQTDPVGYKDQQNLYAYVANDPIMGRDPRGECKFVEGKGEVGICGNDADSRDVVNTALADRNSMAKGVEAMAVEKGLRVGLQAVANDDRVGGAQYTRDVGSGGTITIDVKDAVVNENPDGNTRTLTQGELLEHEFNNARNFMTGGPIDPGNGDHAGSIAAENAYRDRAGIPYHREIGAVQHVNPGKIPKIDFDLSKLQKK